MSMSLILADKGVRWIVGGWIFFMGENIVLSHNRSEIIQYTGDREYHLMYSALSTTACGSILWGYFRHGRNKGPVLWRVGSPVHQAGALLLQTMGLIGFSQLLPRLQLPIAINATGGHAPVEPLTRNAPVAAQESPPPPRQLVSVRCPMDFTPADVPADGVYGLKRVTRHPTFWSLGLLGLGTAMTTPLAAEVL
jgi:uncharacterized membrane protein